MNKIWTCRIHSEYIAAFRRTIPRPDRRYEVHEAIHEALSRVDDPERQATSILNRPNHYIIEVMGYQIPFKVIDSDTLLLLPIKALKRP